jgi:hypothetical protein
MNLFNQFHFFEEITKTGNENLLELSSLAQIAEKVVQEQKIELQLLRKNSEGLKQMSNLEKITWWVFVDRNNSALANLFREKLLIVENGIARLITNNELKRLIEIKSRRLNLDSTYHLASAVKFYQRSKNISALLSFLLN